MVCENVKQQPVNGPVNDLLASVIYDTLPRLTDVWIIQRSKALWFLDKASVGEDIFVASRLTKKAISDDYLQKDD